MDHIKEIKVGDVLVLSTKEVISDETAARLKAHAVDVFNCPVVVLSGDINLSVVSKTPNMVNDILQFHRKFGLEYAGKPRVIEDSLFHFRRRFMQEELDEYEASMRILIAELVHNDPGDVDQGVITHHLEKALDALVDLVYVALGTAHLHGFDFNEAWRRVHEANMKKVRAPSAEASAASTGRGHAADVIKPPGWESPSHKDLIEDHAHLPEARHMSEKFEEKPKYDLGY